MNEEEILDSGQSQTKSDKQKRPIAITVICILGFIGAAFTIPIIFSSLGEAIASWYPPYLGLSATIGLLSMIGLWKMKKWGAYIYTGFVLLNQIILLSSGLWTVISLIVPGIIVGIALFHLNKMD